MIMGGSHTYDPNQKEKAYQPRDDCPVRGQRLIKVGNWEWNLVTREYVWSDEMYQIFKGEPRQFPMRTGAFLNCVHPDDKQKVVRALGKALVGEQSYQIEHRIVWPNGLIRIIHGEAEVTFDERGRPIRMLGRVLDITEGRQV
jgi:PAS domain-containing protein